MNWISVAKRLPKKWGPHLVYCGRDTSDMPIYIVTTWDGINGVWRCEDGGLIATVHYWAEITAPEDTR